MLERAEQNLRQARRDRAEQRSKTADAADVNRKLDLVEARNDVSGLIAEIFGYRGES